MFTSGVKIYNYGACATVSLLWTKQSSEGYLLCLQQVNNYVVTLLIVSETMAVLFLCTTTAVGWPGCCSSSRGNFWFMLGYLPLGVSGMALCQQFSHVSSAAVGFCCIRESRDSGKCVMNSTNLQLWNQQLRDMSRQIAAVNDSLLITAAVERVEITSMIQPSIIHSAKWRYVLECYSRGWPTVSILKLSAILHSVSNYAWPGST